MCPGPKTVPEVLPLATTRRGRSVLAPPSLPRAKALAAKGDENREGPCLVGTARISRIRPKHYAKGPQPTAKMEPALLLQIIGTLFSPQDHSAAEQSWETTWKVE